MSLRPKNAIVPAPKLAVCASERQAAPSREGVMRERALGDGRKIMVRKGNRSRMNLSPLWNRLGIADGKSGYTGILCEVEAASLSPVRYAIRFRASPGNRVTAIVGCNDR